jgi:DNA-binding transcriptional LysR family regulator
MRQLESRLGVPLFEQIGKELHLTDAGRTLEREARLLLGHVGRIEEAVRAHREGVVGRLRIGASTTPGFYLLPTALGSFHATHPKVELELAVDTSKAIEQRLIRNEIDLAFVGGRIAHPDVCAKECLVDEVVCFARKRVGAAALRSELCVLREEGSATRQLFERWIADKGGPPERTMVVRCPDALKTMVAAGIGYSFLSVHGVGPELERGELRRLAVTGMKLTRPITMAWHVGKHLSPTIRAFIDSVDAAIAKGWRR